MASDGSVPFGSTGVMPTCCRRPCSLAGPERLEHLHRRNVERLRQRRANGDGAVPALVEVLRHVEAEARRLILDQRFRMGEAGLERQPVDQRLQGRARRAHRLRHVDRTETALVEIAGRADVRDHLAGLVIDHHQRRRQAPAQRRRARAPAARGWPAPARRASGDAPAASCSAPPRRRPDAAPASGKSRRTVGMRSALARSASSLDRAAAARSSTRLRARRAASP